MRDKFPKYVCKFTNKTIRGRRATHRFLCGFILSHPVYASLRQRRCSPTDTVTCGMRTMHIECLDCNAYGIVFVTTSTCWRQLMNGAINRNKKPSYRRDSARRRSLRRSTSSKVTDISTNRKPARDFLLVTSYMSPFYMQLQCSNGQIIAFDNGVPLVNAFVLGSLYEYRHKSYIATS